MGVSNSNSIDQQNFVIQRHLKNLKIQNVHLYRFVSKGNNQSIVIQNVQNHINYLLKTLIVTAEEDAISLTRILQKRNKITCIHLCKVLAYKKQQQSLACSEIHKLHLAIQCPLKSLKNIFYQKIQKNVGTITKQYFHQSELWGIAYSIVKALKSLYLYGIVHQSLSLQSIYIDQKGLVKLADPALFGLQKNYISAMKEKQNCKKILSPQILVFLDEFNFYFYQKQKSDIFVLGILLLHLCILAQFPVYDYQQKVPRFQLIQINLNQIKNRYSSRLHSILEWMTQEEPKKRPRLNQLLDFIDKNNNSDKSTSVSNTVLDAPTQVFSIPFEKTIQRNKTVSAFSIYQKPVDNNFVYTSNKGNSYSQSNLQDIAKQRKQTQQGKDIFPFQLVYNRVINNNENMKRFQIQNLYKQYKNYDLYSSSCRGSVPSSSYHAKIQFSSKQIPNKNIKMYDAMNFSKKSMSKNQYLIYSQSSALNVSNKLSLSKNSLGDIKLVESNHFKETEQHKKFIKQQFVISSNIIEDINQQTSIQSPYRKLTSHKNSEGKSLTSIKYLDVEPIVNKTSQLKHSDILQKYIEQSKGNISLHDHINELQSRYFSQQQQKQIKINVIQNSFQTYQSQLLKGDGSSRHLTDKKQQNLKLQERYDKYLLSDKIINKENDKHLLSQQIVDSSKNMSFQSSELQSKLSRATPNFAEKSHKQTGSQKQSLKQYNQLQENDILFVENDITQQGSIYTGYRSKEGLKQRHGKLQFHDGGYYEGQWKNDKMEGYGQLYYASGALAYKGLWLDGCFSGNGQIFNDKPEKLYEAFNFRNFTQIEDKWLSYQGEFQNDSKHGKGRINLTNGQYFEGIFDYDMIEGHGVFYTQTGQSIKGLWKDNQLVEYE